MRKYVIVPATLAAGSAFAAVPEAVTTAISGAQADLLSVAGLVIAMGATVWGVIKLDRKFGWF